MPNQEELEQELLELAPDVIKQKTLDELIDIPDIVGRNIISSNIKGGNLQVGFKDKVLKFGKTQDGSDSGKLALWMGDKDYSLAPFSVDENGDVTMTSATISGYITVGGAASDVNDGATNINPGSVLISGSTNLDDWRNSNDYTKIDGGKIYAGSAIVIGSSGYLRSGQTAYDTGTGWWIGDVSGTPKFSIGDSAGEKLLWDGSNLDITGSITASSYKTANSGDRIEINTSGYSNQFVCFDTTNDYRLKISSSEIVLFDSSDDTDNISSIKFSSGFDFQIQGGVGGNFWHYYMDAASLSADGYTTPELGTSSKRWGKLWVDSIDANGSIVPTSANSYNLGGGTDEWNNIYASGSLYDGSGNNRTINDIVTSSGGASQLTDLSDVDSASQTGGYVLKSDGANYYGGGLAHSSLTGVGSSDHHSKYTDAEAVSAVENEGQINFSGNVNAAGYNGDFNKVYISGSPIGTYYLYVTGGNARFVNNIHIDGAIDFKTSSINHLAYDGSGAIEFESANIKSKKNIISTNNDNLGDATNYWNDIQYKTLTDVGCLGCFDNGVELRDGSIVSDVEAIESIKKHPTKQTVYGVPRFDYRTMPKAVYKKAAINGKKLKRDKNDRPYIIENGKKRYGKDGAETTALISIMIGAIKELNNRIKTLESKI